MSLTGRLTAFFLVALALVLAGFSTTVLLLASSYLERQLDERLNAALDTLVAVAENDDEGLEWDVGERRLQLGGEIQWTVHADGGQLIDASPELGEHDPLRRALQPDEFKSGRLREKQIGDDREGRRLMLNARVPPSSRRSSQPKYATLIFTVAASEKPGEELLERLGAALIGASIGAWLIALFAGRWFCRRALRPVTEMAEQARQMTAEQQAERLTVPPTRDELEALGRSFNGLLDRLHEALERQRRFTGDASHQLRTPLTALLGQIDVALRQPRSPEEYQQTLHQVRQQGEHLRQIIEMLLCLTRADAETQLDELAPLDLAAWLPAHLAAWSAHPRSRDLQLQFKSNEPSRAKVHPPLLGQLLDSLLDNACKYSEPGTPIEIELASSTRGIELTIADRGIGIDERDVPHLFEPFFRAEAARLAGRTGLGLGLAIAHRLSRLFGGTLTVESRVGQGSRFTVTLPRS